MLIIPPLLPERPALFCPISSHVSSEYTIELRVGLPPESPDPDCGPVQEDLQFNWTVFANDCISRFGICLKRSADHGNIPSRAQCRIEWRNLRRVYGEKGIK